MPNVVASTIAASASGLFIDLTLNMNGGTGGMTGTSAFVFLVNGSERACPAPVVVGGNVLRFVIDASVKTGDTAILSYLVGDWRSVNEGFLLSSFTLPVDMTGLAVIAGNENDLEFVQLAFDMIEENGKTTTFLSPGVGTYDPTTGDNVTALTSSFTRKVCPPSTFNRYQLPSDNVQRDDVMAWVAALNLPFTLLRGRTRVDIDGIEYGLESFTPVYSGEQIALYGLQLRK